MVLKPITTTTITTITTTTTTTTLNKLESSTISRQFLLVSFVLRDSVGGFEPVQYSYLITQ
ncbi:hypothetical protein E2C01_065221 [Portunus trituberculatus]|uniref:Uncharacterized protein n=1 Tax=Portunus trituberculatus TaxID=210409 RepID=A0A5B7HMU9_PORTR|nr:hypothetical protein [Portunus trituberculatus]